MTSSEKLQAILDQELDFFKTVLQFSKKFRDEVNQLPVNVISNMVHYRQEWVEKIQKLEKERANLAVDESSERADAVLREISDIAEQLVEIDRQIYQSLQNKKLKFIREHADTAGQRPSNLNNNRSILDIRQG